MLMAFGIGANDAANSWATTVGSGALPLRWACLLGGAMEWAGAVAIGYGVAKTIKGVAKPDAPECFACGYCDSKMGLYTVAMFSALFAAAIFLLIATFTWMPVSTTHAIIGAALGATWVATGWGCLNWAIDGGLGGIVLSWVISPAVSGTLCALAWTVTQFTILNPKLGGNPRTNAIWGIPLLYSAQTFVIIFMILLKGPTTKKWPLSRMIYIAVAAAAAMFAAAIPFALLFVKKRLPSVVAARKLAADAEAGAPAGPEEDAAAVPRAATRNTAGALELMEKNRERVAQAKTGDGLGPPCCGLGGAAEPHSMLEEHSAAEVAKMEPGKVLGLSAEFTPDETLSEEQVDAVFCFRYLLVFVAALESFAHGSNDTGNATGAFSAVLQTYSEGLSECSSPTTPVWVMAVAGLFVALGVNVLGYRVIRTIGTSLTDINYHRGWSVEFASTFTVVIATIVGMPVSTTHCQVGAVVAVGLCAFGPKHVSFGLFGKIFATWILTLPFAAGIAAGMTAALRLAVN